MNIQLDTQFALVLVLTCILRVVSGTGKMAVYRKISNHKVQSNSAPLQTSNPNSLIECAAICLGLPNCKSFDIEKTSSTCHLYQWKLFSIPKTAAILVNSVGWDHYETREGMSQNILYN